MTIAFNLKIPYSPTIFLAIQIFEGDLLKDIILYRIEQYKSIKDRINDHSFKKKNKKKNQIS